MYLVHGVTWAVLKLIPHISSHVLNGARLNVGHFKLRTLLSLCSYAQREQSRLCPREAAVNKIPCLTGAADLCQGHSSEYDLSEAKLSSIVYICPSTFILLKVNSFERHLCTVCACVLMPQRVCKCTYAYHKYGGQRPTYRRQFFIPPF